MNAADIITSHLAARGIDVHRVDETGPPGQYRISGRMWHPMPVPGRTRQGPVQVAVPVAGIVRCDAHGAVDDLSLSPPTVDDVDEVRRFVASLAAHGQIEGPGSTAGATHALQRQPDGALRLIRKGFAGS